MIETHSLLALEDKMCFPNLHEKIWLEEAMESAIEDVYMHNLFQIFGRWKIASDRCLFLCIRPLPTEECLV